MTSINARAEHIAAFYARQADRIRRIVTAKVQDPATAEDACQNAWAILLRRDDIALDRAAVKWLATVAIHEGWRLQRRADVPIGAMQPGLPVEGEIGELAANEPGPAERTLARIEHDARVADLRTLKPRERRDLYLKALGYRYHEIADLTGSTYTAVNRRLTEGRAQLRRLAQEREGAGSPPH